jgi:serine phosphatase RsbU (regulator of sigma subunit)
MSKILLLLDQKENRRVLAECLAARHEIVADGCDAAIQEPFDLCIVDGHALNRMLPLIRARKAAEEKVFLPVLLVASRHGAGMAKGSLWENVDELIATPIEKAELQARVEILLRARRLSSENAVLLRQLEVELNLAANVQTDLLPSQLPKLPGFEIAARSQAAREVGGDFYDWQQLDPDTLVFTVGDAMGRGMSAALLMAMVRAAVRTVARLHPPAPALELVRSGLEGDLIRTMSFVTLFHARLDAAARRLLFVDAGHAHFFIRHPDGSFENMHPRGPALGIPLRKPYQEGVFTFTPGDTLIIYTDGIIDAQPDLGLDHAALAKSLECSTSAAEMVERLLAIATGENSPPEDDITAVALRCLP